MKRRIVIKLKGDAEQSVSVQNMSETQAYNSLMAAAAALHMKLNGKPELTVTTKQGETIIDANAQEIDLPIVSHVTQSFIGEENA